MTAYIVVATVAWAVAMRGGTGPRDLVVILALLTTVTIWNRAWPGNDPATWAAFGALMAWLLIAGPARSGWGLEAIRTPALVLAVVLVALIVRRLPSDERQTLRSGLIAVGCIQAMIALVEFALAVVNGESVAPRSSALLGSSNALGVLLVSTAALTAREVDRRPSWVLRAAMIVQICGVIASGSRTAILIGSLLLLVYLLTHVGWISSLVAALALGAGTVIVTWRSSAEPLTDRFLLWTAAMKRIAEQPFVGSGTPAQPFISTTPGVRITTHAHNEILQWGVEYGLVGVGLCLALVLLALRTLHRPISSDRWVQVSALVVLTAGTTDFTLRITAMTLISAILVTLAMARTPGADVTAVARAVSDTTTARPHFAPVRDLATAGGVRPLRRPPHREP